MFKQGMQKERPLTYDVLANILRALGAKIERVIVRAHRFCTSVSDDDSPIGFKSAFINLSRSATAYFGNSFRSFFSCFTSVVNCSGSCSAKAS
jgi:hypothetical protein